MPLSKPMLDLLATIKDEDDRKILAEKFEKYEPIQKRFEGNLRQEDYDRQMNESKKSLEEAVGKAKEWQTWADTNVPRHQNLLDEHRRATERNQALEKQVKEANDKLALAGTGGEDMTEEQLKKVEESVQSRIAGRIVSKDEVQTIITQELGKVNDTVTKIRKEAEDQMNKVTLPAWSAFVKESTRVQFRHRDDFGKPLDEDAFIKFVADGKYESTSGSMKEAFNRAYDDFTREARDKAKEEKMREDIEKDVRSKITIPGSGVSPVPELGAVEMMRRNHKEPAVPEGAKLGDGSLAAAAAAELRSEGKG